jgi:hypothetical protein
MRPFRAFLLSFAIGLVTLNGGYAVFSTLTAPEPLPALQGPLYVPVA